MTCSTFHHAHLSEINPDFAPLVPAIDKAFKQIWTYSDLTEFRDNWKTPAVYAPYVPSEGFEITHERVPASDGTEIEIRIYKAQASSSDKLPLLFVLHGGGWVVGGHDSENGVCRSVCVYNQAIVISVDYRRAPEHRFPRALLDSFDVLLWTTKVASRLGCDNEKIVVCGTSSGANLAAALTLYVRDQKAPIKIAAQILNIPVLCHPKLFPTHKYELHSYMQNAESPTINADHMRWFWNQYDPAVTRDHMASPLLAESHEGLPPALIQVAGLDPLRDEGLAYAQALKAAEVDVKLEIYPGLPHGFMLAIDQEFTQRYYRTIVDWITTLF